MAFNTSGMASGAGTGAVYGGMYGGPVGSAIGAGIGGVLSLFRGRRRPKKKSTLDPEQQRLRQQMLEALESGTGPLADIYSFNPEELQNLWQKGLVDPSMANWNEEVVPGITGSFRGQNLQNSSYLGSSLSKSGQRLQSDLDAKLAAMLYEGKQSAMNRRGNAYSNLMNQKTFEYQEPQQNEIDALLSGLSSGAGDIIAEMAKDRYRRRNTQQPNNSNSGRVGGRAGTEF